MGANAQTSVPTFTAGEILTAANMNISARTGIPVFADSTARDAGFGGTGEKTLAEGQFAYLESTNETQYYDGSTWQAVGLAAATQADQETGTSTTTTVTPGRQQYHQSACKFWVQFVGSTAAISSSYNVSSVTDVGTGAFTVNINVDMSSTTYGVVTGVSFASGVTEGPQVSINNDIGLGAGTVPLVVQNPTATGRIDCNFVWVAGFGDQ